MKKIVCRQYGPKPSFQLAGVNIGRAYLYVCTSKNIDVCIQEIPFYYLKKQLKNSLKKARTLIG